MTTSLVDCVFDGSPAISPVLQLRRRPSGREPEATTTLTSSPVITGNTEKIDPLTSEKDVVLYAIEGGLITVKYIVMVKDPPAFEAQSVTEERGLVFVGDPLMTPFVVLKDNPAGKEPDWIEYSHGSPLSVGSAKKGFSTAIVKS